MRSPFTQLYEPGSITDTIPLADHQTFKDVETNVLFYYHQLNSIMQNYVKMYFGEGTGNFYSLLGDETTLRGIFIAQSTGKEEKKIKNGSWKTIAPVVCKITASEDGIRSIKKARDKWL